MAQVAVEVAAVTIAVRIMVAELSVIFVVIVELLVVVVTTIVIVIIRFKVNDRDTCAIGGEVGGLGRRDLGRDRPSRRRT